MRPADRAIFLDASKLDVNVHDFLAKDQVRGQELVMPGWEWTPPGKPKTIELYLESYFG